MFNVVSVEHLSINSRFAAVPHRFCAEDITETAIVGVAFCEGGRLTAFTLAADGRLSFVSNGGASYTMEHERLVCDLSTMACNIWQPVSDTPLQLPFYDGGHTRIKLHTAVADIVITRNVMIDLGSDFPIECDDFLRWPATHATCIRLSRGERNGQQVGDHASAHWPDAATREPMALHGSRAVAPQAEAWRAPRASRSPRAPARPNDPIHRACWRRGGRRSHPGRLWTCLRAAAGRRGNRKALH